MSTVSLAALFEALDIPCREALEQAAVNCAARGGYEITIDDYMECLLPLDDMRDILAQFERNVEILREILAKNRPPAGRHTGRPSFSPLLYQLLQEAYLLTTLELRQERINAGALVLALLRNPVRYGALPFYRELKEISADALFRQLEGLNEERHPAGPKRNESEAGGGALAQYAVDFTEEARNGKIDPVFARGPEIRLVVDILPRRRQNQGCQKIGPRARQHRRQHCRRHQHRWPVDLLLVLLKEPGEEKDQSDLHKLRGLEPADDRQVDPPSGAAPKAAQLARNDHRQENSHTADIHQTAAFHQLPVIHQRDGDG